VAKGDAGRLAAVFAADPDLQFGMHAAPAAHGILHQRPDSASVEDLERILPEDLQLEITRDERGFRIVAAVAVSRLREIVGPEREELRARRRKFVCHRTGARQFDHRADVILHLHSGLLDDRICDFAGGIRGKLHLFFAPHAGNHHLRLGVHTAAAQFARRFEDRTYLHCINLGIKNTEPAHTQPEHGILFVQLLHALEDLQSFAIAGG
jgi:hypothetical protein